MKKNIAFFIFLVVLFFNCTKSSGILPTENPKEDVIITDDDANLSSEEIEKITYRASNSVIINPERGFYKYADFRSNANNVLTKETVQRYRKEGISLLYTVYYMYDFRNQRISDAYLQRIRTNMQALRDGGSKAILRFSYTSDENQKPWDAPWHITEQHIAQLKPIFQEYADVICLLQAGFVGVWGEWYYTDNYVFQPKKDQYEPRKKVLETLLEALPKERMVCVRYPQAKLYAYNITPNQVITLQTAHDGSSISRIGFHNDCFLADKDDTGTFQNVAEYRTYWKNETKFVPMGGETCKVSSFSACQNALKDMRDYHWSYINQDYKEEVIKNWDRDNCLDEIKKNLGYRLVLSEGTFSKKAIIGKTFSIDLKLKNVGWAAPFNPRDVQIVFVGKETSRTVKLKNDPRFWFPNEEITIKARFNLPENLPEGTYDIYLNLPDPKPTLANRSEFSIQLANEGLWDEQKGYNKLHSVQVTKN